MGSITIAVTSYRRSGAYMSDSSPYIIMKTITVIQQTSWEPGELD